MPQPDMPKVLSRVVLLALALTGTGSAWAQDAAPHFGIEWQCVQRQDERFEVACVARPVRPDNVDEAAFAAQFKAAIERGRIDGGSEGKLVPTFMGRDMRSVAARGMAAVFSGDAWLVPLFVRPADPTAVTHLLQGVLCDRAQQCTVTYRGILSASTR